MPLVPAAGYPYQPFPSERAPLGPPSDYQNIPSSPLDFGAQVGQATERLGAAGQQVSSEISQRAIERQSLYNQIAADSAQTQYMKESHRVLFGDPETGDTGFFGKHGEEAMHAAPAVGKQLNEISERIGGGLANARQRLEFNEYTRRLRVWTDRDVLTHYEKEMSTYGQETQKARAATAAETAANKYNDEEYVQNQLHLGIDAVVKQFQGMGFGRDSERTNLAVSAYKDKFAGDIVNSYLANNDPSGAERWMKSHPGFVTNPKVEQQINREVHTKSIVAETRQEIFGKPTQLHDDPAETVIKYENPERNPDLGYRGVDLSGAAHRPDGFPIW